MSMDLELSGLNIHRGVLSLKLLAEKKRIKKTKNQSKHPKLHKQKTKKKKPSTNQPPKKPKLTTKAKHHKTKTTKQTKNKPKKKNLVGFFS